MARPRKKIFDKKTFQVNIRLTLKDYIKVSDSAKQVGLTIVEFVRRSSLNKRLPRTNLHPVNRKLLADLSRYGNNLNQIAKKMHQKHSEEYYLFKELKEVKELFNAIKISLLNDSEAN